MVGKYEIKQGNKPVGTMDVSREGLYYHFRGKCNFVQKQIFRVRMVCAGSEENLGVLLPCNGIFLLDTKRPVKQFSDATPPFVVTSSTVANWISLNENTPFPMLVALENGVFQRRDGVPGILFTDQEPSRPGSDPTPSHPYIWVSRRFCPQFD